MAFKQSWGDGVVTGYESVLKNKAMMGREVDNWSIMSQLANP